jgi:hypothetical protein
MNRSRRELVEQIFDSISKNSHSVDTKTFLRHFLFKHDRDYISGKRSEQQVIDRFVHDFNLGEHRETDDQIEKEDFLNFYGAMSFGANSDAYFDLYMRQTWKF